MERRPREAFDLLKESFNDFLEDDCMSMAAALAYYSIFSLPPLLIILMTLAGIFMSPEQVEQAIQAQTADVIGKQAAQQIQSILKSASGLQSTGLGLGLGLAGLLFGATTAFAQLQYALNRIWAIQPGPDREGVRGFLWKRVLSLGMILLIALLLLVSLVLSAIISALGSSLTNVIPFGQTVLWGLNVGISLAVVTLLFASIFKVLPDAKIRWSHVWMGAFSTAVLFEIGKYLISFYLGQSNPTEAYGAAGSLALLLLWAYYSTLILFLGAEWTQAWALRDGTGIEPDRGAVWRDEKKPQVSA